MEKRLATLLETVSIYSVKRGIIVPFQRTRMKNRELRFEISFGCPSEHIRVPNIWYAENFLAATLPQSEWFLLELMAGSLTSLPFPIDVGACERPKRNQISSRYQFSYQRRKELPVPTE